MTSDNVTPFPGSETFIIGGERTGMTIGLQTVVRESARHGFERKLKGMWNRFDASDLNREQKIFARADFLDAGLLFARVAKFRTRASWKQVFSNVVGYIKTEAHRLNCDPVTFLLACYRDEKIRREWLRDAVALDTEFKQEN